MMWTLSRGSAPVKSQLGATEVSCGPLFLAPKAGKFKDRVAPSEVDRCKRQIQSEGTSPTFFTCKEETEIGIKDCARISKLMGWPRGQIASFMSHKTGKVEGQ